jgi:hypothetical protein
MMPTGTRATDQPALSRTLGLVATTAPSLAARVQATLDILLADVAHSQAQEQAWKFSLLTKRGFPFELTWASHDDSLRYTVEVAGPEIDLRQRLTQAARLLAALGAQPAQVVDRLRAVQATGTLEWGTWLGVRHQAGGDRYKIYVQVPEDSACQAEELVRGFLGAEPVLPPGAAQLVAIGQELGSARIEFYYRVKHLGLAYWEVGYLMRRVGLAARQVDLLGLVEDIRGYTLDQRRPPLPEGTYGISLSVMADGRSPVCSIFTFPGSLIGGDGAIRRALLQLSQRRGWNFDAYAALTEPLSGLRKDRHHDAIAFVVAERGEPGLHISLSPPEPDKPSTI